MDIIIFLIIRLMLLRGAQKFMTGRNFPIYAQMQAV